MFHSILLTLLSFILISPFEAFAENIDWDFSKAKPLDYAIVSEEKTVKGSGRVQMDMLITLIERDESTFKRDNKQEQYTKEDFALTALGAAKYFQQTTGASIVTVVLNSNPHKSDYGNERLAFIVYIPDGKGYNGKQDIKYDNFDVASEGLSPLELDVTELWGSLRDQYQKNDMTDEEALTEEICKQLNIEKLPMTYKMLTKVPVSRKLDDIAPHQPVGTFIMK